MYIITGSDCLSTICYFLKDKQQSTVPHFFPHYWKGGGKLFHELASPACSELQLSQQFRDSYKPHLMSQFPLHPISHNLANISGAFWWLWIGLHFSWLGYVQPVSKEGFFLPTVIKCWTLCQERHRWDRSLKLGCPQPAAGLLCPDHPYQQWVFRGPAYLVDVASAIVCGPSFWRCICLCCCSGSLWVWCEEGHHLWSDTWEAPSTDVFVAFAVDKCSSLYCSMNSRS